MKKYLKKQNSPVFFKILNEKEVLQVTNELLCIGISVHSRFMQELFSEDYVEIQKDEFIAAYSEVKRQLINQNILQEEEKELYLSELFQEWADTYFKSNNLQELNKEAAFVSLKHFHPTITNTISSAMFKRLLISWCSYNGYQFQDRILKIVNGYTTEHIRVTPLH